MNPIKIEQIAIHVPDVKEYAKALGESLGLGEWVFDRVVGEVSMWPHGDGDQWESVADLAFNYQLGYEFELLHYVSGQNWHNMRGIDDMAKPFMSHKGCHVPSVDKVVEEMTKRGIRCIQYMTTKSHTNKYLIEQNRTFKYAIFDTKATLGFDYKVIERIQPELPKKKVDSSEIADAIKGAADLFTERNEAYGDNFVSFGPMMAAAFPDGVTLKTPADFTRWHLFELAMVKNSRYAQNFAKGGHADSTADNIVYSAMLGWVDEMAKQGRI